MLQSDRVDMIAVSIHGFAYLANQLKINANDYEHVWTINKIGNYFAFNINTEDNVINAYQKTFDEIEAQRTRIKESYQLPKAEF